MDAQKPCATPDGTSLSGQTREDELASEIKALKKELKREREQLRKAKKTISTLKKEKANRLRKVKEFNKRMAAMAAKDEEEQASRKLEREKTHEDWRVCMANLEEMHSTVDRMRRDIRSSYCW